MVRFDPRSLKYVLEAIEGAGSVGLGSGSTVAAFLRFASERGALGPGSTFFPSSLQIATVAREIGLRLGSTRLMGKMQVTVDGADQVLEGGVCIKGGGGALLMEKILWSASGKIFVLAAREKFSARLSVPIPVEVHPAAVGGLLDRLAQLGGKGEVRASARGYPFTSEGGNLVVDAAFGSPDLSSLEKELKLVPGVAEVGIFRFPNAVLHALE
ncbi:MAG: ribose 5-phosphate isomerase A [Nitrososphaerota archaeon]|nr:ribose 5-phosphate isomerase A [Nitrososphaerota archaeon]MDG6939589.1 ribose 5-phosphate isomerase A [Nitrososphaerota archaeon]